MINRMVIMSNQGKIMDQTAKQRRPNRVKAKHLTAKRPRLGRKFNKFGHEEKDSNQNASSSDNSNFTTVLVRDSIIKQIQGWKLGKKAGHRVVVKFSGATTSDMKHYLKPTLLKNPQQSLLHVGTNDLRDQNLNMVVGNAVELARKIESETNARIIFIYRNWWQDRITFPVIQ